MSSSSANQLNAQKSWRQVTYNMGTTNIRRAKDARKAANHLAVLRSRY